LIFILPRNLLQYNETFSHGGPGSDFKGEKPVSELKKTAYPFKNGQP
jgi:hypothetical protein